MSLDRRDAFLYLVAAALGSFGLGIVAFYLNFLYRALGFGETTIGALQASQALGAFASAWPGARYAGGHSRRAALLLGGTVTGAGVVGIIVTEGVWPQAVAAFLLGAGGILVATTGAALLADASLANGRFRLIGGQIAIGTSSAFLASALAGALAVPVATTLGRGEADPLVIRALLLAGGAVAAVSALPVLALRGARVSSATLSSPRRASVMRRFVVVGIWFGFGAGSFLPFLNLFLADRLGIAFGALGIVLGALAVAGSAGALLHGHFVVPVLGPLRAIAFTWLASVPWALAGALPLGLPGVSGALAVRASLAYGASASLSAYLLSSFTPAERVGATTVFYLAYSGAAALGSLLSGAIRGEFGDVGWTVNLATLGACYGIAALSLLRLFRAHEPAGDAAGRLSAAAPDFEG